MSIKDKKENSKNPLNQPKNINQICKGCELRKFWCNKYKLRYNETLYFDYYDCILKCPYDLTEYQLKSMEEKDKWVK